MKRCRSRAGLEYGLLGSHCDGKRGVLLRASWNTPNEDIGLKLSTNQALLEILKWCDQKRDVAACRALNGRAIAEEDATVTQRRKTDSQHPTKHTQQWIIYSFNRARKKADE